MTMPTNTPMVSDEYTSLVMSARANASNGGTMDQAPVLISSKASSISLPFLHKVLRVHCESVYKCSGRTASGFRPEGFHVKQKE